MEKYQDNYHKKFNRVYGKGEFTGRIFNPVELIHHLDNINFRFESGEIEKLSDEAIEKIKPRFRFYQYGASVDGIAGIMDDSYTAEFMKLVAGYGEKYGFRKENAETSEG